jgi:hypothetical protein
MFDPDSDSFDPIDPVGLIREGLACLAGEDRSGWPAGVLSDLVVDLLAVRERLDAEVLRAVGRWDAISAWADDGALSGSGWLADRAELTRGAARRLVRTAGLAYRNDGTGEALAEGKVTATAVETMATLACRHEDVFADDEECLVKIAGKLGADEFVVAMCHWRDIADDNDETRDPYKRFERRYFRISPTLGGSKIDGFLDPEGAAALTAALDAIDTPDPNNGETKPRSLGQRRADALVELARESLALTTRGGRIPANVDAVLDVNALLGDPPDGIIPAHAIHRAPVSRSTIERLCCDVYIGRAIMRGRSEVLDLGRRSRVVSAAQMRALVLRDQHCRFPGCDRPAHWTEAHHVIPWEKGGPTEPQNLALLCSRHHHVIHKPGWKTKLNADATLHVTMPDGTIRTSHPPGHVRLADPQPRGST